MNPWRVEALAVPLRFFLSQPLSLKLAGSHLILTAPGLFVLYRASGSLSRPVLLMTTLLWVALIPVSWALAYLALRPLRVLDIALSQAASGRYSVRVPQTPLEDISFASLRAQVNTLLEIVDDDLLSARNALQALVLSSTAERSRLQAVLHESLAQSFFVISCQLSALEADAPHLSPEALAESLEALRVLTRAASSDLAALARSMDGVSGQASY